MPPRRRVYEEESEDAASEEEAQSDPVEDDELDMDVDEDAEAEEDAEGEEVDDIDVVGDGTHDDEGVVDDKDVVEEDVEDELIDDVSDPDRLSSPAPTSGRLPTRLKIRLKLPVGGLSSTIHTSPRARRRAAAVRTSDIESEDEDEEEDDEEGTTRSTSVATAGAGARALTARQAVLANVVDSSHVALSEPPNPRKKKPLTEIEIALKREETARKRRNLTEKKLEDEKAETINRLLKKQSRARGKRNALSTAEDRPGPGEAAGEGEEEEIVEAFAPPPTMYRWVSSARSPSTPAKGEAGEAVPEPVMTLSFSVPVSALPHKEEGENVMEVDSGNGSLHIPPPPRLPPAELPKCDVQGCTSLRKYRLVRDFQKGACGLSHLKALEA
ncbi:PAPA-1-like conserved region-domain-containing protein [Dichomitus squalens]|uniref:PAPA-1-like conserved region-domain-containing protein n=1 Tax=Dichomitus squalens TaxID=114155 RepID=A0A4Q9QB89_9APHY|nr:PAPA-1-like conserved region-domain-containing protein [Dichomitus squalens]